MWNSIRGIVEVAAHSLLLVSVVLVLPLILMMQVVGAAFPQVGA